jgi:flagella basal body P-ring formation protein FlgA
MKVLIVVLMFLGCLGGVCAQEQTLPAIKITDAIASYIATHSAVAREVLFIDYKNPLVDESLPMGKVDIVISTVAHAKFVGFTPLGVEILLDNKPYKKFMVYANVDSKVKAYMATRWINYHEPLTSDNLVLVSTYRSKVPLDCVVNEKELSGKVAKMALPKGKIISYSSIDIPPVVINRSVVVVRLETAHLKIMSKGIALMDGRTGEVIKLRLLDSKKEIYAKVIDATTVLVQIPN